MKRVIAIGLIATGLVWIAEFYGVLLPFGINVVWGGILVGIGILKLIERRGQEITVVGFYMLLGVMLIAGNFELVFPILILLFGVRLLMPGVFSSKEAKNGLEHFDTVTILGGRNVYCDTETFSGGSAIVFCGGCEINLRSANITESPVVVELLAVMGGIEVIVPRHWNVKVDVLPIMGGVEDRLKSSSNEDVLNKDNDSQLIVKGVAFWGGVEVKYCD